jgi:glycosyltransferase involved in cell wall biosynthesis
MKIAMLTDIRSSFDSLTHVYNNTESVLARNFQIVRPPADYEEASEARKFRINAELIEACDVVLARRDLRFLRARERLGRHIPYCLLLFGGAPRGMPYLSSLWRCLRTSDVLVGNCIGDVSITKAFFPNSQATSIPFPVDESRFCPLPVATRRKARAALGLSDRDTMLLYAGRITLEKNVHTLIVMFSALQKLDPNLHLVLAGSVFDLDFEDFGVMVSHMKRWLARLAANLGVDRKRLRFVGHKTPAQLRELYNAADVLVNMTLHHDENFGLPQAEAMACGTPVVGTDWGGLKETILDGVTGSKVSTFVTGAGVKSSWLEAAGKVLDVVRRNRANRKMSESCRREAVERYSLEKYAQDLADLLASAASARCPGERLKLSEFGREVWQICSRTLDGNAPYRRGPRSFHLYQRLIRPYATRFSREENHPANIRHWKGLVYLPWPITSGAGAIEIHDPMFPMKISVPRRHQRVVMNVAHDMDNNVVVATKTLANLVRTRLPYHNPFEVQRAVKWMLDAGILLRAERRTARKVGEAFGGFGDKRCFSFEHI